MKPINYLLFIILISWNVVSAQKYVNPTYDPYFIETLDTVSTYGPKTITRNILQDKNGNYWFATWQGIMRYDSKEFTNFTLSKALMHYRVFSVLEDKAGNIWFGTIGAGVYRYDGKSFTQFTTKDGLVNNKVTSMMEDKAGNIWFGTDNGVSRYDGDSFNNFTKQFNPLSGKEVNAMVQDKTGKIWFGSRHGDGEGISCYDGRYFTNFENKQNLHFTNVRSIIIDKNGTIWIGGNNGLFRYGGDSLVKVSTDFVGFIYEDKTGNIWWSSGVVDPDKGMAFIVSNTLYRFDGKTLHKITEKREPENNQIFGITEDKSGNIWFGTGKGVFSYDGKSFTGFEK